VFHLAVRNIVVSTKYPELDFEVNARGVFNVLLAARNHRIKRIIYASSASIYGNPKYLPINEDDYVSILNPYAAGKSAGENYCFAFYETYKIPMVILRYSNVYGINQRPENPYSGVVSKFFKLAMEGKATQIHGDGEQTRDFTYVDDVVEATLLAAVSPKAEGEVFNVSSGIETSINRLAKLISELNGNSLEAIHIDRRDIDNIRRRVLNIEKIRHALRWIPSTTLEIGLQKTYQWLKSIK
jgi:UDP-glucose 4-epimerase